MIGGKTLKKKGVIVLSVAMIGVSLLNGCGTKKEESDVSINESGNLENNVEYTLSKHDSHPETKVIIETSSVESSVEMTTNIEETSNDSIDDSSLINTLEESSEEIVESSEESISESVVESTSEDIIESSEEIEVNNKVMHGATEVLHKICNIESESALVCLYDNGDVYIADALKDTDYESRMTYLMHLSSEDLEKAKEIANNDEDLGNFIFKKYEEILLDRTVYKNFGSVRVQIYPNGEVYVDEEREEPYHEWYMEYSTTLSAEDLEKVKELIKKSEDGDDEELKNFIVKNFHG